MFFWVLDTPSRGDQRGKVIEVEVEVEMEQKQRFQLRRTIGCKHGVEQQPKPIFRLHIYATFYTLDVTFQPALDYAIVFFQLSTHTARSPEPRSLMASQQMSGKSDRFVVGTCMAVVVRLDEHSKGCTSSGCV